MSSMGNDAVRNGDLFAQHGAAPATPKAAADAMTASVAPRPVPETPERPAAPPVMRVSACVQSARLLLERNLGLLWIGGEISGCNRAPSGHLYFTVKDATAQVRCVFFRSKAQA